MHEDREVEMGETHVMKPLLRAVHVVKLQTLMRVFVLHGSDAQDLAHEALWCD